MTFYVGQPVEYVDDRPNRWGDVPTDLRVRHVYTIKALTEVGGILLHEVPCPADYLGYHAWRFRPVVDRKSSVSFTTGADPESERYDNRKTKECVR